LFSQGFLEPKQTLPAMSNNLLWKRELLPNGVRLLLYPKPATMTAQLSVVIQYGSNDDSDAEAGAAHFLEHMVPGGSPQRIDLSREVERLGGFLDFFTNHEYTMSLADVTPDKLAQASHLMSKMFLSGSFEEEQFCSERKIIFHELAEIADDPREKVDEILTQSLFKTHPVRRPIGGYVKTVRNLSMEQLTRVYLQHYVPQNMLLILTGRFSEEDVQTAIQDFGSKPAPKISAKEAVLADGSAPLQKVCKKKAGLAQTYMSIGARTANSGNPDIPTLDLLNVILGAGASSRLFIELREKRAYTYEVGSMQTDGSDFGFFNINCAVKQKHVEEAERLILKEISKLKTEKVPEGELEKAKNMILGDVYRSIDDAESCAEIIASMEIQFDNENALIDYISKVKTVTSDDIRDVANRYMQEDKFVTAILEPKT
jgi:predicted Zn-dependent peptidase